MGKYYISVIDSTKTSKKRKVNDQYLLDLRKCLVDSIFLETKKVKIDSKSCFEISKTNFDLLKQSSHIQQDSFNNILYYNEDTAKEIFDFVFKTSLDYSDLELLSKFC